jgi:hypothetical protein
MPVQTQLQQRRGTAASWTSTNPTLAAGEIGFESDTGKIKIGNGSTAWNALAYTASSTAVTYLYNATAAQTTFSGADANGLTLAYTVGAEQVYLNGALQVRGSDYTATNGTSIVLASGALVNDVLNVIAFSAMSVADTYTQAQANALFIPDAIVDAKGDLIAATASDTVARLAVGADGAVLQADSSTATGLSWAGPLFAAGKNKIINGDFGVWQRGTSFASAADGAYTGDRWQFFKDGTATVTVSQQSFTPGTAPVSGYESQYFLRVAPTAYTSGNVGIRQNIEDVRTFAGQTVTISFWAKATSSQSNTVLYLQNFGSGGSGSVNASAGTVTIGTAWSRHSVTVAIPSISGKTLGAGNYLQIQFLRYAANNTVDIWGVQIEAGSTATAFQTATGTIQGELAACQRYYWRATPGQNGSRFSAFLGGTSATDSYGTINNPVPMRVHPTSVDYSALNVLGANTSAFAVTSLAATASLGTINNSGISVFVASGLGGNIWYTLQTSSASGFIGLSAEL